MVGPALGFALGTKDGKIEGSVLGEVRGWSEGSWEGSSKGAWEGTSDGDPDGKALGVVLGESDSLAALGEPDGNFTMEEGTGLLVGVLETVPDQSKSPLWPQPVPPPQYFWSSSRVQRRPVAPAPAQMAMTCW